MNSTFSLQELEKAVDTLKDCKSPGPDKITNEMIKHLDQRLNISYRKFSIKAGSQDKFHRHGEKPTWYRYSKKERTRQTLEATDPYV